MAAGKIRGPWATVCEIEPGLFQAIYSNAGAATEINELPEYQAASSVADAKRGFERSAYTLGFGPITWIEVNVADLVIPKPGRGGSALDAALTPGPLFEHADLV